MKNKGEFYRMLELVAASDINEVNDFDTEDELETEEEVKKYRRKQKRRESRRILIERVKDRVRKTRKAGLPKRFNDFICYF